ncbi:alkaline-phosphatase-like protein, partial [Obelidium mucronatum]
MITNLILAVAAAGGILAKKQPNIILLLSDDQDVRMNSLEYMPILQKHLGEEGTKFEKHYVTTALCCPSRVSILKGQFAHNTNFTDVGPPTGGYDVFLENNLDEEYLPVWLQRAGYATHYIGKFVNGYGVPNHKNVPRGWNSFDALVNPWVYDFYHPVLANGGGEPKHYPGIHQVDVIREKALNILETVDKETPFFLYISPSAPHTTVGFTGETAIKTSESIPADRHRHLFPLEKIPRTPSFNSESVSGKPRYIESLPLLNQTTIDTLDHWYRQRLRNLQSIDELLGSVIETLKRQNQLDNTYIFYSADNGYHIGLHRLNAGKTTPYEDDVNVPFYVRGPGVAKGKVRQDVNSHTDFAPTFLKLAGATQTAYPFDGEPIPIHEDEEADRNRETLGVEFWRPAGGEFSPIPHGEENTYRSLRINGVGYSYLYTVWCTGHRELYDNIKDPFQLKNIYETASAKLVNRLDALLVAVHDCKGTTCQKPWNTLLPGINNLGEALNPKFDGFFSGQHKLVIRQCLPYYDIGNEVIIKNSESAADYVIVGGVPPAEVNRFRAEPLIVQDGRADFEFERETHAKTKFKGTVSPKHKVVDGDIERYGVPLTEEEIRLAYHPHAYDYD